MRLHGLYLLSFDDRFAELCETDTAEGFISDLVVKPRVNRIIARNITILEHACCAPEGSVRGYRNGTPLRQPDPRPAGQLALCADIQAGVLHFVDHLAEFSAAEGLDPFDDLDLAAHREAAILARLLLLPTDDELQLLGGIQHDINLGTQTFGRDGRSGRGGTVQRRAGRAGLPGAAYAERDGSYRQPGRPAAIGAPGHPPADGSANRGKPAVGVVGPQGTV